jgi:hypothetical protein
MREDILSYHYSDRLKAILIIAGNLLQAYEDSRRREDIMYALFDALEGEINLSWAVLSKEATWAERGLEEARHNLHQSIRQFNLGDVKGSEEYISRAISNVTTIAEKSFERLGL